MKKYKLLLLFILIINTTLSKAQRHQLKFEQIGINEGLSQSTVRCVFQDSKGFMWFGTKDGLNQYDGYKFTVYKRNPLNTNSLASNDIKSIVDDKDKNLWIATWDGGLNLYDPRTEKYTHYLNNGHKNSIASNFLESLCRDEKNNIWIGTANDGLDYLNTKTNKFTHYKFSKTDINSLINNSISTVYEDSKKNIWIGTSKGLNLFDRISKKFKRFINNPKNGQSLSDNHVKFIYEDRSKNLWVGTYNGGLNRLDIKTGHFVVYKKENSKLSSNALISIAEDHLGKLWIGTENGGLNIFDPLKNSFINITYSGNDINGISSNTINAIFNDKKGNLWLGTLNGGINLAKRNNENFTHYKHEQGENSLVNNIVNCIYEDSKQNLWIGTDGGGLDLFNPKTKIFTNFRHSNDRHSISGDYVLSVCEDKYGDLWIGTWGKGISVYSPSSKTFKTYKNDVNDAGSLNSNYAFNIFKDTKDRIWIGTYGGGLDLYNPLNEKFIHCVHNDKNPASISSNNILTIDEDQNHNLLIGTDGAGLSILNPITGKCSFYKTFTAKNSISNNSVSGIYRDKENRIWLATNDGLNQINEKTGKTISYFKENGLPSNLITGILPDKRNNLWISTDNGLSKFNLNSKTFKNYTRADGLQANEFKYAKCLSKTEQMYFGGINGFNQFFPDSITDLNYDPPIVFTNFEVFNKHVALGQDLKSGLNINVTYTPKIELLYNQSVFTFEFSSLNFVNKEKKQYAYILEGFDNQWHYLGTRNNLTYTNLDPGTYILKIKGYTNNGHFSSKTAKILIVIKPPFWKTWWFESLIILLLIALTIVIFYLRFNTIKKRNRYLEVEVAKRTLELKETNIALTANNEQIRVQNGKLEAFNKEVTDKSEEIFKQQEYILLQNTELENTITELKKSNLTKDRFLSILAHDLRNPIAAIAGIAENLHLQIANITKVEITKYISTIKDSSKSVLDLLLNLLKWAKTQNQTLKCIPENINLFSLIAKNQVLMEQLMRSKNIYLTINVDHEHMVFADKNMIETVIRNLLTNCIKFTPAYGQISIASKETQNEIMLTFYDNGIGMSQNQIENLFKIETATSTPGANGETGSGLGLIIIKEFTEANKGSISVNSSINEGSTFTISLPKVSGAVFESKTDDGKYTIVYEDTYTDKIVDQKKIKLQGKRLLYVDDNIEMRAYLNLILSPTFEVLEAQNGQEAIRAAIEFQPEIIITDMLMPVMNGAELCKKLKLNSLTSHIPVIMLTSQTDVDSQLNCYEAGADTYLMKPVNQQILFQVIYNLIINQINARSKFVDSEEVYPDNFTYNARDKDFMDKIIAYVEKNISQSNLDHKDLCEAVAMSRTVLYAKIKSLTGQGVHEFMQSIRVKKGLQLLMEGRLNINQIAYEVGFNTPSYFSKCFTKQFGIPPKDYLSKLQSLAKS